MHMGHDLLCFFFTNNNLKTLLDLILTVSAYFLRNKLGYFFLHSKLIFNLLAVGWYVCVWLTVLFQFILDIC